MSKKRFQHNGRMRKSEPRPALQPMRRGKWDKVERNAPCPCGSGKKYKKCHWRAVQEQRRVVNVWAKKQGSQSRKGKARAAGAQL